MAITKLQFDDSFFDEEIRSDYLVSSDIKRVWAVCLDLLNEFIDVCDRYGLDYSVMYGTLLGAIRHKGFIPWDDDIDIVMDRKNYDRLCEIAPQAFVEPYFFQNDYSDFGFTRGFSRLRNSSTTAIQRYEQYAEVPYNQGIWIDIFPLDFMPNNEKQRESFGKRIHRLHRRMWNRSNKDIRFSPKQEKTFFDRLYNKYYIWRKRLFIKRGKMNPYRVRLEKETRKYNREETEYMGVVYAYRKLDGREQIFKKQDFENLIQVPFEMLSVMVPKNHQEILKNLYGEWQQFVIGNSTHGEVIFDTTIPYKEFIRNS